MFWIRPRNNLAWRLMLTALLVPLAFLLSSCAVKTKTVPILTEASCPAPEVPEWSPEDLDFLAAEIEIGNPDPDSDEFDREKAKLRIKLNQVLLASEPSLWEEFPFVYDSAREYWVLREQIEICPR